MKKNVCLNKTEMPLFGDIASETKWRIVLETIRFNGWENLDYDQVQSIAFEIEKMWNQRLCELED